MIEFFLGDESRSCDLPADTTVLDYLRDHQGLTGTKEGCASGDCGACTVVVARPEEGTLVYEPVNACIATLGSLHGKQLITVEQLQEDGHLHPVQRAMVDHHGSQCGFCTPGFIMSLFALFHRDGALDRGDIIEGLGGNLCRCTGYRPILDAAVEALGDERQDRFSARESQTHAALEALSIDSSDPALRQDSAHGYFRPRSSDEVALLLLEHPEARLVAGGTDLMLEVTQALNGLPKLIDISCVGSLQQVVADDRTLSFGAAVTHEQSRRAVLADYPELAELIERFGSRQIRSRGTIAGNVANASPIGDWPPVLLALDGTLGLRSASGRREISCDSFFLNYRKTDLADGEYIEQVHLPRRPDDLFLRAYKISKRFEDDISSVCLVIALTLDGDRVTGARIGVGGMAAIPKRATACESALTGLDLRSGDLQPAMDALDEEFAPIDDARATALYRQTVSRNLLTRLQHEYRGEAHSRAHEVLAHG